MSINESEKKIIPEQQQGTETGAEVEITADSKEEAVILFIKAKERLANVSEWKKYAGVGSAEFCLTDPHGNKVFRFPRKDDLIRIDLPGPGPKSGNGYDWVRIEKIEENFDPEKDEEFFGFRVRPYSMPSSVGSSSHFYSEEATSSFIIQRKGNKLMAMEEGKNEIVNTKTEKVTDKIRNAVVAAGAMLGLASLQWKSLVKGILQGNSA
jgi:hypothetical protein